MNLESPAATLTQPEIFYRSGLAKKKWDYWLKHLLLSLAIMMFVLAVPIRWGVEWRPPAEKQIQIEIDKTPQTPVVEPQPEIIEEPIEPPVEEVIPPPVIEIPEEQPEPMPATQAGEMTPEVPPLEEAVPQPTTQETPQQSAEQPNQQSAEQVNQDSTETTINSGIIFNSIQNIDKDISIHEDFMAAPKTQGFKSRQWEATDLQSDIPYVNNETDKPRVDMNFYAPGFEGSIERFFDKITVEKEFTTKYGTKIKCAMVGILMACSWK
ncbi:hypothetical protein [Marinicella sp. W31]|uniref:hypothetical protein n=1 Tax=Marinicella sp. W31 TaxID=3023713 RepID=UPI003757D2F8